MIANQLLMRGFSPRMGAANKAMNKGAEYEREIASASGMAAIAK
jgi:hypothetical protein